LFKNNDVYSGARCLLFRQIAVLIPQYYESTFGVFLASYLGMKRLNLKLIAFVVFVTFVSEVHAYKIVMAKEAIPYEMQSCIRGEEVQGCRGIILKDVLLKDLWGRVQLVRSLYFRNLRSGDEPASRECVEAMAAQIGQFSKSSKTMKKLSNISRSKWRNGRDGSILTFPIRVKHSGVSENFPSYALLTANSPYSFYLKTPSGLECSMEASFEDFPQDRKIDLRREEGNAEEMISLESSLRNKPQELDTSIASEVEDENRVSPCLEDDSLEVVTKEQEQSFEDYVEIGKKLYEKDVIIESDITYSALNIKAAEAKIMVETYDDKIEALSLEGTFDAFGMKGGMVETIKVEKLMRGNPLGFSAEPGLRPVLKITAASNFTPEQGGELKFEFWNGKKYQTVNTEFKRDAEGKFKAYVLNKGKAQEINHLQANIRGLSSSAMRVHNYQVSSQN